MARGMPVTIREKCANTSFWQRRFDPLPEMFSTSGLPILPGLVGRCDFARLLLRSLEFRARVGSHGFYIRYGSRCADREKRGDQVSAFVEFRDCHPVGFAVVTYKECSFTPAASMMPRAAFSRFDGLSIIPFADVADSTLLLRKVA